MALSLGHHCVKVAAVELGVTPCLLPTGSSMETRGGRETIDLPAMREQSGLRCVSCFKIRHTQTPFTSYLHISHLAYIVPLFTSLECPLASHCVISACVIVREDDAPSRPRNDQPGSRNLLRTRRAHMNTCPAARLHTDSPPRGAPSFPTSLPPTQ